MSTDSDFVDALHEHRIVGILRSPSADAAITAGRRLLDAGLAVIEVSLNTPDAVRAIATLRESGQHRPDILVGAGTVMTGDDTRRVADAGAQFVVAPVFDPTTVATARELGLPALPGCATPTEIWQAHVAGAAAIKIFPASEWTPVGLAELLQPMPFLQLVPTAGVSDKNAVDWLRAGAAALGMGSALESPEVLRRVIEIAREHRATKVS